MSDGDMMDDEDYDFDYEDSDQDQDDGQVDMENEYYTAKGNLQEGRLSEALAGFQKVLDMQKDKGEWGFKALKQTVKALFRQNRYQEMMDRYKELLNYLHVVTKNQSEKVMTKIVDFVSGSSDMDFLEKFYDTTLSALKESQNERLWFKTNMKLAKLWFDKREFHRLQKILRELHRSCMTDAGQDDQKKGTQLLELYSLDIQMHTVKKDNKKLRGTYDKAMKVKSAIPHPLIMGVIHECGGKMHMQERDWASASKCLFDAFKNYDEAGNHKRIQCLKYLILGKMLSMEEANIFEAPEVKPYKNDPEITAMNDLMTAYQRNEISNFEKILNQNQQRIMEDPFIRVYIQDLLKNIRTQVLVQTIKPYTRIKIPSIAKELNIPEHDVESLLVSLILDKAIVARIDQVNRIVILDKTDEATNKYEALDQWRDELGKLHTTVVSKMGV
uniref:PCI domain-containing protein n=2 Tax=Hemiselmis andersenii TaxID=464988 RepID=A0A7S1GVW3_HEMAN